MSELTVIVPTVLGGPRLIRLLDSLDLERSGAEAIVVDNASGDPQVAALAERSGVEVLPFERNVGFSRAVNVAARAARSKRIVLLNDDCACEPGFLDAIGAALDPARGIVMAAGVMRDAGNPSLIDSAGMELDATLLVFDYLNGEPVSRLDEGVADPIGPSAAAAAFDREAFLDVGGFDERLFAYWEDVDLVLRLRAAGARCALAATAIGTHEHSATLGSGSARKNELMGFGRGYVLRKWGAMRSPRRAAAVLARDVVLCAGQALVDRNLAGVRGRVAGWRSADPENPYPADAVSSQAPGALATLARRAARRKRLVSRRRSGAAAGAVFVFHLADISGPARCLEPAIEVVGDRPRTFVLPGPGQLDLELSPRGEVAKLPYRPLVWPAGFLGPLRGLARVVGEVAAFRRLIKDRRPAVVVVATSMLPSALVAARLSGVPAVAYVAELRSRFRDSNRVRELAGRFTSNVVARATSAVVACSQAVAAPYESRNGLSTTTIYPPIGARYASGDGDAFRSRHGVPADAPLLLSVGAITRGRGQDTLVRAFAILRRRHPALHLTIVGIPYERASDLAFDAELRELAIAEGVSEALTFAGFEAHVEDAYAAAEVFVNPARFEEPFGRASFEALVAGCPVVSTRVGAVTELLRHGENALLVSPDDPEQIAEAVERLLDDRELGQALAERGAAVAREQLDPAAARERWAEVIEAVSGGGLASASERR